MGYLDTKQLIVETLTSRVGSNQIKPSEHQKFALSMLEYIRSVELISGSTLIGIAEAETTPIQSKVANECYVAVCPAGGSVTFEKFLDNDGKPLEYSATENTAAVILLLWNKEYWSMTAVVIPIPSVPTPTPTPAESDIVVTDSETSDLEFSDEKGNAVVEFKDGHIRTKNFDSRNLTNGIRVEGTKLIIDSTKGYNIRVEGSKLIIE